MSLMCVIFFFQAEDGIRDGHVTGVQTCALPILSSARLSTRCSTDCTSEVTRVRITTPSSKSTSSRRKTRAARKPTFGRSEERRVGKEWRARGAPTQYKKKQTTRRRIAQESTTSR